MQSLDAGRGRIAIREIKNVVLNVMRGCRVWMQGLDVRYGCKAGAYAIRPYGKSITTGHSNSPITLPLTAPL
jgi:hypothetical protein